MVENIVVAIKQLNIREVLPQQMWLVQISVNADVDPQIVPVYSWWRINMY